MRLAILNDIHYGPAQEGSQRRCEIAPILLKRAVRRLNQLEKPDLTLVLGDLLNDGTLPDSTARLTLLRKILDTLKSPYLAIPGNHDGDIEAFYRVFDRPRQIEDHCGVRFLPFLDEEQPHYCARRSRPDIERFAMARSGFRGPVVSVQHTCLFPPERAHAPHNFTNAPDVIRAMKEAGTVLSVSGHHHRGIEDLREGRLLFVNAPAFCEYPFTYTIATIDPQGKAETERRSLAMPRLLRLVDTHLHTQMAFCSDDMDVATSIQLARDFGLAGLRITEHSGQLYFCRKEYWGNTCLREGMSAASREHDRMAAYLALKETFGTEYVQVGLEADCDYHGNLLIADSDRARFDHIVGALHGLPHVSTDPAESARIQDDFLFLVESTLKQGVVSLAHPFRVFTRSGMTIPEALFHPTAKLLKQYGVAAELNFHTHLPPVAFVRMCLDQGIRFSLASDAHDLSEIGDFAYHLDLLKQAGFDGDLQDVLLKT